MHYEAVYIVYVLRDIIFGMEEILTEMRALIRYFPNKTDQVNEC